MLYLKNRLKIQIPKTKQLIWKHNHYLQCQICNRVTKPTSETGDYYYALLKLYLPHRYDKKIYTVLQIASKCISINTLILTENHCVLGYSWWINKNYSSCSVV